MYEICKTFRFEAAHRLVDHDGKCARPHGHSWVFRLFARGRSLQHSGPQRNMLVDFGVLSKIGKQLASEFDHTDLNEVLPGAEGMVTSEWLATYIHDRCAGMRPGLVFAVEVEETCTSRCRFSSAE